ncbi:MAG: type II secretion system F family protein [bacterium]|nr:type II secretion system F family protein [bacterium]
MLSTKGSRFVNDELILFTRHLSGAVGMALPLGQTLEVMAKEMNGRAFGKTLMKIKEQVDEGVPLSQALSKHERYFPEYYCRLVAAGEKGNTLKEILDQLGNYLERMFKLNKRVRAALAYPSVVGVLILFDIFLVGFIGLVPRFKAIFSEMGATLPTTTMLFFSIGEKFFYYLGGLICLIILLAILYFTTGLFRSRKGKFLLDRILLNLPLTGIVSRRIAAARFTRTLGSLLRGGVPLPEALRLVAETGSNAVVKQAILDVRKQVEEGEKFGKELAGTEAFPKTMVWMISMGEDKGTLEATLDHLAEYYDTQVESSIAVATAIFEPLVIIIIGIMVAFFVTAMFLPLFNIISFIR